MYGGVVVNMMVRTGRTGTGSGRVGDGDGDGGGGEVGGRDMRQRREVGGG